MPTIFTKIINGEIPCYKIAENETCFAFLDISPLAEGHALVIPKTETDYIFDIEDPAYTQLMQFAKRVASALKKSVPCKRIGVAVIGLEVPHAHIHLVPLNTMSDINFSKPKLNPSQEQLAAVVSKIKASL